MNIFTEEELQKQGFPDGIQRVRNFYRCKHCCAYNLNTRNAMNHDCNKLRENINKKSCDPGQRIGGFYRQAGKKYV